MTYNTKNGKWVEEFFEKSNITKMKYTPYTFALHAHL